MSTYVDLNPPGAILSDILAASSTQQGGWSQMPGQEYRATLWSGTPGSAVVIEPPGMFNSRVLAMTETRQGGYVRAPGSDSHAALWSGSAASFVDLNPPGYDSSGIGGMFGDEQVGAAAVGTILRAAMWNGSAASFRSMHPFATGTSTMLATCGSAQVGLMNSSSFSGGGNRAAIWFGTPESVFDLSQFLPPGHSQSIATCIEERNGVFTVGGYARYNNIDQAFVWIGVPAPGTGALFGCAAMVVLRRRRESALAATSSC